MEDIREERWALPVRLEHVVGEDADEGLQATNNHNGETCARVSGCCAARARAGKHSPIMECAVLKCEVAWAERDQ